MDWITFTKQQVENDALPSVCMVCGEPATCWVNRPFSCTPGWVEYLYFAGFFPGMIAEALFTKKMRVACPLCENHRNHWRKLPWVASVGWILILIFAGIGFLAGIAMIPDSMTARYVGLGVGGAIGLIAWLLVLIYLANIRIKVTRISDDDITFQGVSDVFVKTAKDQPKAGAL